MTDFGKQRDFQFVSFAPEIFEESISIFKDIKKKNSGKFKFRLVYRSGDEKIEVKRDDVHFRHEAYRSEFFNIRVSALDIGYLSFFYMNRNLNVDIDGVDELSQAARVLAPFGTAYEKSRIPEKDILKELTVFIGHGRSGLWRELKDHLADKHGLKVEAYETGARAGFTIQQILSELSDNASIAFLVHTGEDPDSSGMLRARENVIHETGLFQGALGFEKAIVVLEEGCNEFSNIAGLQQIRFHKGRIQEVFGDVLSVIRREFIKKNPRRSP